jgi:flagellar biosynthesis chaperone FliJ
MTSAAPAAAEPISAPVEAPAIHEAPAQAERSEPSETGERAAKVVSRREAIDKAFASVEAPEQPAAKPDVKPTGERARNPDGTFASSAAPEQAANAPEKAQDATQQQTQAKPLDEPPARFSPDAKAAWAQAPEPVRGEIRRAITELENGLAAKNQQLEAFKPLESYAQAAAQQGTNLKSVIDNYLGWETRLKQDPENGFVGLLQNMGQDPVAFAQSVLERAGVTPGDHTGTVNQLRGQVQQYQQNLTTMQQEMESLRTELLQYANKELETVAKEKPGFDELRPVMGKLMKDGWAESVEDAYAMASRLRPDLIPSPAAPVGQPPAPEMAQPAQAVAPVQQAQTPQTRKANLSVTGAPGSGSHPAHRKPPTTRGEAIDRAFARAGLA